MTKTRTTTFPEATARATSWSRGELPHFTSTRDGRDRLDLVTDETVPSARLLRADRIVYHPGDTAAAHFHTDSHHVFSVLYGSGLLHGDGDPVRLEAGMSALVVPGEVHWFENDTDDEFSFVEFWAPPPPETSGPSTEPSAPGHARTEPGLPGTPTPALRSSRPCRGTST